MPAPSAEFHRKAAETLERDWDFVGGKADLRLSLRRLRERWSRGAAPARTVLKPPQMAGFWSVYFVYAPNGALSPVHRWTLERLSALGKVLVVCAASSVADVPGELVERSDALVWKALRGFDFSAYAAGLETLATHAPGSDALVLNDSVFGPLTDLKPWIDRARWDLTGFTATSNVENHLQSYAFLLRAVTPERMVALSPVLSTKWSYDRFWGVVLNQETRFARVAARSMRVGAFHYADNAAVEDPTLQLALPMVEAGFPFLKRSLLGKLAHLHPREAVLAALEAAGHPV